MTDAAFQTVVDVFSRFVPVMERVGPYGAHVVAYEVHKLWPEWVELSARLPGTGPAGPMDPRTRAKIDFFTRRLSRECHA